MALLEVSGARARYGAIEALAGVSLTVGEAESVRIFKRTIRQMMEVFLRFTHRYWFHDVSNQWIARDVFANRFEIQDSDSSAAAREKLERGIVELLGEKDGTLHAHFIGQLLGLDFGASPWLREILNDPGQIRHRAFQSFAHFF